MGYDEKSTEGGSNYTYSQTYRWKFDAKNLPMEFYYGDFEWDIVKFSWRYDEYNRYKKRGCRLTSSFFVSVCKRIYSAGFRPE